MQKSQGEMVKRTYWFDKEDMEKLDQYYQGFGSKSRVIRALLHRHIKKLDALTAQKLSTQEEILQPNELEE